MLLAFGIDQLQKARCPLFRAAQAKATRPSCFWETFRGMFLNVVVGDWETLYKALAFGHRTELVPFDTS